jgi:hypothetical protein
MSAKLMQSNGITKYFWIKKAKRHKGARPYPSPLYRLSIKRPEKLLSVVLITNGQLFATMSPACCEHPAAILC